MTTILERFLYYLVYHNWVKTSLTRYVSATSHIQPVLMYRNMATILHTGK